MLWGGGIEPNLTLPRFGYFGTRTPFQLRKVMITDNQLDSLATGLGLTMMALIVVSFPALGSCFWIGSH
jgi:hypothetical protein